MASTGTSTTTIDNGVVRVTRWDLQPEAGTGVHMHHVDYVVVPLTVGRLRVVSSQGEESFTDIHPGASYFRQAGAVHEVSNAGAAPLCFVEVELTTGEG